MPSRIRSDRTHMDVSVLANCPELQAIPMNKPQLAAIAGGKIYRPQKAAYMFENLPLSKAQKESLLIDFVERSMKTKPKTIPPHRYATRVTDHLSVVPSTTRPIATQTYNPFQSLAQAARAAQASSASGNGNGNGNGSQSSGEPVVNLMDAYGYNEPSGPEGPDDDDNASDAGTDEEGDELPIHPSRQQNPFMGMGWQGQPIAGSSSAESPAYREFQAPRPTPSVSPGLIVGFPQHAVEEPPQHTPRSLGLPSIRPSRSRVHPSS